MKISLSISCNVELIRSDKPGWDSNNKEAFQVSESGGSLTIRQKHGVGSTTVISSGGNTIIQSGGGRNISIGNVSGATVIGGASGGVWINGRRVDIPEDDSPMPEIPFLKVYVPDGSDVDLKTSASVDAIGDANIGHLALSTSGSSDINLTAYSASLSTSGSSDIQLRLTGGKLRSHFSGSTDLVLL